MSDALRLRLKQVMTEGEGIVFLSPHLDDAVLSCGALLSTLRGQAPITVVTVFSASGPAPYTRAARSFLRQCATPDAADLFARRRQEDMAVLDELGVDALHLDVPDALFRRREGGAILARIGRIVPELAHRYPTFWLDIAKGRVSPGDLALLDRLDTRLRAVLDRGDVGLVFAPVGVGRHVDHLLTRRLGERYADRLVLYADFPYHLRHPADGGYLAAHRLEPVTWGECVERKPALIRGYRTQAAALFPRGDIPLLPETYYL